MSDLIREQTVVDEAALLALGSDARVEVVDGEIVEMSPVGGEHHDIANNFHWALASFVREHQLGLVYFDGLLYLLNKSSGGLRGARVPDISFIAKDAIPIDWERKRPFPGAPTLAVEVVSPDDKPEDIVRRVGDYLDAGTAHVLVIYPEARQVYHYRAGHDTIRVYSKPDEAPDLADILPDLRIPLAAIFAQPAF